MFPRVVIEDIEDFCKIVGVFRGILPTEAEIIETEFRHEINTMKEEPIERAVKEGRYQEFRAGNQLCRKHFIHQTKKETELTGANLFIEIEGQKVVFFQVKREGAKHRFQFDRKQMTQLIWLNDEIIEKTFSHSSFFPYFPPYFPHNLSYRVPYFYKLIFLKLPFKRSFRHEEVQIEEEQFVPVKQVDFILGRRKSASSKELRTGYTPSEFQTTIEKCEVGSPDLVDENMKKRIFLEYSIFTNRLVVYLCMRKKWSTRNT